MKLVTFGLVLVIAVMIGILLRPKPQPPVSASCPQEKVVTVDLEKSTYSDTNVVTLAGGITGEFAFETLEYDLVAYKGGLDAIYEIDAFKNSELDPDVGRHTGWQAAKVSTRAPLTFTISPTFPPDFANEMFLGIYFRVSCADGTATPDNKLTRMVIDRHLFGNRLYAVTANNPIKSKYLK